MALAVESEDPLIKFLVVEEYIEPSSFLSLRTLQEKIGNQKLMMRYFSDKSYIWSLLLQSLSGLVCLN